MFPTITNEDNDTKQISFEPEKDGTHLNESELDSEGPDSEGIKLECPGSEEPEQVSWTANEARNFTQPEEIIYIDEIKGMYRNVKTMESPIYVHKAFKTGNAAVREHLPNPEISFITAQLFILPSLPLVIL